MFTVRVRTLSSSHHHHLLLLSAPFLFSFSSAYESSSPPRIFLLRVLFSCTSFSSLLLLLLFGATQKSALLMMSSRLSRGLPTDILPQNFPFSYTFIKPTRAYHYIFVYCYTFRRDSAIGPSINQYLELAVV